MIAGTLEIQMLANMARLQQDMDAAKRSVGSAMESIERSVGLAKNALLGLAGVASLDAFKGMIEDTIKATAELDKLSRMSGITAANLSALKGVAKLAGTDLESIIGASNKLIKNMAAMNDDGTNAARVLASIGLSAKTLKSESPDQVLKDIAVALEGFGEGQGKVNAAIALMGKNGAAALPFLHELAIAGELHAKVTDEQVASAKEYEDNMIRLKAASEKWKKTLSLEVLPALTEITAAMTEAVKEAGLLQGAFIGFGGLASKYFADPWKAAFLGVGAGIDEFFANIHHRLGNTKAELAELASAQAKWNQIAAMGVSPSASGATSKPPLNTPDKPENPLAQQLSEAEKAYNSLVEASIKYRAEMDATLVKGEKLTKGEQMLAEAHELLTPKLFKELEAYLKRNIEIEKAVKLEADFQKASDAALKRATDNYDAELKSIDALQQQTERQLEHNASLGLGADALDQMRLKRIDDDIAREKSLLLGLSELDQDLQQIKVIRDKIQALDDYRAAVAGEGAARKAHEQFQELKRGWEETDRIGREVFDGLGDKGVNMAHRAGDALKSALKSAIYEATFKPLAFQIYNSATSALGVPGAGGGGLNAASGASNLFGGGSSLYTSFATSSFGSSLGLSAPAGLMGPTAGGGALGGLTALGEAVPWIAAAAVIANAVGLFGKGGGPQSGQYGQQTSAGGYTAAYTLSGGDSLGNQALSNSVMTQIAALAAAAGKSAADITLGQGYKLDPQGTAAGMAYRDIAINGRTIVGGGGMANPGWTGGHDDAAGAATFLGTLHTSEIQALITALGDPKLISASDALMAQYGELEKSLPLYLTAQAAQKALTDSLMTDAEKLTAAHQALAAAGIPETVKGFKDMASNLPLTTQAGQDMLAKMIALKPALDLVTQSTTAVTVAVDSVAQSLIAQGTDLQIQLLQAQGDKMGAFYAAVARDTDGMTDAQRALYNYNMGLRFQIQTLNDATAATEAAAQAAAANAAAVSNQRGGLQDQLDQLLMTPAQLLDKQRSALDESNRGLFDQIQAAKEAAALQLAAQQAAADQAAAAQAAKQAAADQERAAQQIRDTWQNTANSIVDTMRKLRGDLLGPQVGFAQTQADFALATAAARAGDQTAAQRLPQLAQAVVDLGRAVSVTSLDQALLTARTLASLQSTVQGMAAFGIALPSYAVGTDYVPRDMVARIHQGERIVPRSENNDGDTSAAIATLRQGVSDLVTATRAMASDIKTTKDLWVQVTRDGVSVVTTT